jgi:hypothetical protein
MEAPTLGWKPMSRARSKLQCFRRCARPTGDSHGLTARGPTQRFKVQCEGRAKGRSKTRGQGQYKGRSPLAKETPTL